MTKPALWVQGMHGLGDNIHQRAVLRQLMKTHSITLETSWPAVYHDLIGPDLRLVRRPVALRTQTKNAIREGDKFLPLNHTGGSTMRIRYGGAEVQRTESGTVLEAMCLTTGVSYTDADYRLPIPQAWRDEIIPSILVSAGRIEKPVMVYRPLVMRPEWPGSGKRNADPQSYAKLMQLIRDTFFVISIADLEPNKEWLVGHQLKADLNLHAGELTFETMAALFGVADLVFTSSGFAAILGPAVGTSTVSIVGGYESIGCHDSGARFAPYLAIGPETECGCWTSYCRRTCDKAVALPRAEEQLRAFMSEIGVQIADNVTSFEQMFTNPTVEPPARQAGRAFVAQRQTLALLQQRGLKA